MGMFTALGRRAERVKQAVTSDGTYHCLSCEETLSGDIDSCPHCGSEAVVPAE